MFVQILPSIFIFSNLFFVLTAQKRVVLLQGHQGTYYCGAWMGYGFHEDGLRTGLEVAVAICGNDSSTCFLVLQTKS